MSSYELYERVISAFKENEDTFSAAARNWIEGSESADFGNEEANDLFYTAKIACATWRSKAINGRISKRRMIECVRKIAEMNLPNPYPATKEFGVNPEAVKIVDDPEAIKGSEVKEPVHIMGVIPEEKPKLFNKRKNR